MNGDEDYSMKRLVMLAAVLCRALGVGAAESVVSNVQAAQRSGEVLVDITYDLASDNAGNSSVGVELSEDGGKTYRALNEGITGDFGDGIAPGSKKRIVWEPGVEWLGRSVQFKFRLSAGSVPGMVWIEPGSFMMGSSVGEVDRKADEGPQTRVTLTKGFWLGRHEVTQREWAEVMGSNPSEFQEDAELPVESVTWTEAMEYCRRLTERERSADRLPTGHEYRLPTEAQWEYACRAGRTNATAFGQSLGSTQANFDGNYPFGEGAKGPYLGRTAKVGSYAPNPWRLYDMCGNVGEWCLDWYQDRLPGGSVTDPTGPAQGSYRVIRGGSWHGYAILCRSAYRSYNYPTGRESVVGFRVVLAPRGNLIKTLKVSLPKSSFTYTWTLPSTGGSVNATRVMKLNVNVDGTKLTGKIASPSRLGRSPLEIAIEKGMIRGDEISFTVTREFNGNKLTTKYSGKVSADGINGKIESERNGQTLSRAWKAKREK